MPRLYTDNISYLPVSPSRPWLITLQILNITPTVHTSSTLTSFFNDFKIICVEFGDTIREKNDIDASIIRIITDIYKNSFMQWSYYRENLFYPGKAQP